MATKLYDASWFQKTIHRMAEKVMSDPVRGSGIALIGIRTRGAEMADRIADEIRNLGDDPAVGYLDPTMFRDDLHTGAGLKGIQPTEINFDLNDREVILIDDVILTGRSVRAAIDALFHYGRPACVRLCVMVDRGGRELPIQPDIVGAHVDVPKGGWVRVKMKLTDDRDDAVYVIGEGDEEP